MKSSRAVLSVISAGVLWGVISIFINKLSDAGLSAMNISLIRMGIAAPLFTLTVAAADREKLRISLRDVPLFIGTGIVSVVLFNICYFYTMIHAQASIAVILLYTSPVFIMLLSRLIFKERITLCKLIALAMTFGGCVLVAGLSGDTGLTAFTLMTGFASGLFYGLYTIFGRFALRKYDTLTVTVWTFIFGLIGSLAVGDPVGTVKIVCGSPELMLWCLGIGVICTVLPYFLYTKGLTGMEPSRAAIFVAVEPMVGAVIGIAVFGESAGVLKLIGMALILGAIVLLGLSPEKKEDA
ncbi:MAG: EamA family transporter [Ruminococcus sp.]|nr:EamA family transporter [Ruminococcus sp.]